MEKQSLTFPGNSASKVVKWKVKEGSHVTAGMPVAVYNRTDASGDLKLKATCVGTVKKILHCEGDVVEPGEAVLIIESCSHPIVMKDMCAECGADLRQYTHVSIGQPKKTKEQVQSGKASVAMVHSVPELIVSEQEAIELGKADELSLQKNRKLTLLVDLDQTVIHTTNDNVPPNLKDVYHFQLQHGRSMLWYHTKFRPGTEKFLQSISQLYELHICTFGARMYAHTITRFLDPEGKFFSHRILSRDECFNPVSKTANLKALFPCGDTMVCIIDDREDVWNFASNMIQVKPYIFFDGTADINAPPNVEKSKAGNLTHPKHRARIIKVPRKRKVEGEPVPPGEERPRYKASKMKGGHKQVSFTLGEENDEETEKVSGENPPEKEKGGADNTNETEKVVSAENVKDEKSNECVDNEAEVEDKICEKSDKSEDKSAESSSVEEKSAESVPVNEKSAETASVNEKSNESASVEEKCAESSSVDKKSADSSAVEEKSGTSTSVEVGSGDANVDKPDLVSSSDDVASCSVDGDRKQTDNNDTISGEKSAESTGGADSTVKDTPMECADSVDDKNEQSSAEKCSDKSDDSGIGEKDEEYDELIEWDDTDDYLIYLECILKNIHTAYYDMYDQMKAQGSSSETPDLKTIIPYVKRKVLKGANLLFSGVIPTNQQMEKSRAYRQALALGANVHTSFVSGEDKEKNTTHVVAARTGTEKVRSASGVKDVHIVTPPWFWSCLERWEWVDERLFPLNDESSSKGWDSPDVSKQKARQGTKRKTDQANTGPQNKRLNSSEELEPGEIEEGSPRYDDEEAISDDDYNTISVACVSRERRLSDTVNPIYSFSKEDIDDMDKEVEDILDGVESESDEDGDAEAEADEDEGDDNMDDEEEDHIRKLVLGYKKKTDESSSDESMSGDFPKGWGKKGKRKRNDTETDSVLAEEDPDDAMIKLRIAAGERRERIIDVSDKSSQSDSDSDADHSSIGSVDEEMAAAVEREFLNY